MAEKIKALEKRPHRNPYGITGGLFSSALMVFILIAHYRLNLIDNTFIVLATISLFAMGGIQMGMQKTINSLLDYTCDILKLADYQNELLKMTPVKEKIRLELIQRLEEKNEMQSNLLKLYEKQIALFKGVKND